MQRASAMLAALVLTWNANGRAQEAPKPPELVATTDPRSPEEERSGFHLPPGFAIELVAAEPEIGKPLNLAFDERGRLWVTQSREYPFPAKEGERPRDAVKVLGDFAPDGRARTIRTFADGLNIPIGVLPLGHGRALVHSIPNIYLLEDTDGDGRADRREVAYARIGSRDTHGMTNNFTWGFDGWIYACHGFSNESEVQGADRKPIAMQSGNVYRLRPDGSHDEYVTHGQVNPFGLCFDPRGNLYSADCHSRPIYQLLRGAFYPSFGKPDDGLGFGPEMVGHDHGSTAIAGVIYYAADHFPAAYRGTVFVGNVVTNRINHDRIEWHGSSPKGVEQPDFLVSDDPWFRPVDMEVGPDGAIYVADFYNRIIGHYEVPLTHPGRDHEHGRIWRIVYRGPDGQGKPRSPRQDWSKASIPELIDDLGHPNLAVRTLATNQLADRGGLEAGDAVRAILKGESAPEQRTHGLWVLQRLGALDDATLEAAARDGSAGVRVHAQRIIGEIPEMSSARHELAIAALKDWNADVRRAAAEALGRHPAPENLRPLLDLRHAVAADDAHLLHVVRMAIRDQLRPDATWAFVRDSDWSEADRRALADVANGVPTAEAARFLLDHVRSIAEGRDQLVRIVHHVARYGPELERPLREFARSDRAEDLDHQVALVRAYQQGLQERGAALAGEAREWAVDVVGRRIGSDDDGRAIDAINLAGQLALKEVRDALAAAVADREASEPRRSAAIGSLGSIDPEGSIEPFGRIVAAGDEPGPLRERAALALAQLNSDPARAPLLAALPTVPDRLQSVIAVGLAGSREGAEALLEAVGGGKVSARTLQNRFVELRLEQAGVPDLKARLAKLLEGLPPADQKIQDLIKARREGLADARGDRARGARVFETNCAACHQIDGKGARVGPQLDGVGLRGPDRLLEDVLDPNRNIDQAFRSTTLALADGRVVSGLVLREEGEVLVLADAQGKDVRIPNAEIEERKLTPISPMPADLAEKIKEEDFYDLIAFLLGQKDKGEPKE